MKAKAKKISKWQYLTALFVLMVISLVFISSANAHFKYKYHKYKNIPVALCTTSGTGIPMVPFVCCKVAFHDNDNVRNKDWVPVWVEGGCSTINAHHSRICSVSTPVIATHAPIVGDCQFSHSTREM